MDLAARIQALRKEKGLTQEALADRLGVSRQAIGKWESGQAIPSIDNLLELSAPQPKPLISHPVYRS